VKLAELVELVVELVGEPRFDRLDVEKVKRLNYEYVI
jgi:hypothetical protein